MTTTSASANSTTSPLPEPIFFTFPESVFGRRLQRYLNLRKLPYTSIRVPPNMPRPILQDRLSIYHRRIPILALGRDVYCDTRLILSKLEAIFPDSLKHPALGAKSAFEKGFEEMLENWVIDGGPFWRTSGCLPPQSPLLRDEVWIKDRFDGSGGAFTLDSLARDRAWCISQLRIFFNIMENLLRDGREWVLGDKLGMADLHGCWVFDWGVNMASDMFVAPEEMEEATGDMQRVLHVSEFPRVHGWIKRFREACETAKRENTNARPCGEGQEAEDEAVRRILRSEYVEPEQLIFEDDDVLGLKLGQHVSITPADFGFTHADTGVLVSLSRNEVVIEVEVQCGKEGKLRLHYPRIDFRIAPFNGKDAKEEHKNDNGLVAERSLADAAGT